MGKYNAVDSLRESIRLLEIRQAEEGKIFKEQLLITYESLKPANLIKSTITDVISSVEIRSGLLEAIVSILSGYFTQKMIVRSRSGVFMKILGTILQFGLSGFVAKNIESIRKFMNQQFENMKHLMEEKIPETEQDQVVPSE